MAGRLIGERSTHDVTCMACKQTYGNACQHNCPFTGVAHADMHRDVQRQLLSLAARVVELEAAFLAQANIIAALSSSQEKP